PLFFTLAPTRVRWSRLAAGRVQSGMPSEAHIPELPEQGFRSSLEQRLLHVAVKPGIGQRKTANMRQLLFRGAIFCRVVLKSKGHVGSVYLSFRQLKLWRSEDFQAERAPALSTFDAANLELFHQLEWELLLIFGPVERRHLQLDQPRGSAVETHRSMQRFTAGGVPLREPPKRVRRHQRAKLLVFGICKLARLFVADETLDVRLVTALGPGELEPLPASVDPDQTTEFG